jgi:hypothetical protein
MPVWGEIRVESRIDEILKRLAKRGVSVNAPLDLASRDWNGIAQHFGEAEHIRPIYSRFDGFNEDILDESLFNLWSANKINQERILVFKDQLVIGDYLIQSDFIVVDNDGSIKLKYANKLLAQSLEAFLKHLCEDRFSEPW